ncbi:uncharacterized protein vrs [Eurosta solidaginis]|uniref:uncharacterized protein vrs n=1 Tax=Eurosta solidaginis TaxID=178769 RepID=UPI003530A4D6
MDHFNVPKKVNRHVLKALGALSGGDRKQAISMKHIIDQVKHQMRNLVPVPNIENVVQKSLKNLSEIGLIERRGINRYALGRCAAILPGPSVPTNSKGPDRRVFRGNDPRRCSKSTLDPNMKRGRGCSDEESLSGDEFERTRKRMRTNNKQVRHSGRWAYLPRVRQHDQPNNTIEQRTDFSAAIDTPLIPQDLYSLHHPHTRLQECDVTRCCRDDLGVASSGMLNKPAMDFMLSNVTPSPSIEISEITDDVQKIVDVRIIVETPPLQQQQKDNEEINDYEEAEEGVQTDGLLSAKTFGYSTVASSNEISSKSNGGIKQLQPGSKIATDQNQIPSKSCTSRRILNPTNAVATISQNSSKSLLLDCTKSYIK